MITYDDVCRKLGFDPMTSEDYNNEQFLIEDDNYTDPIETLSDEELNVLIKHIKASA